MEQRIYGIRHHGAGSARRLLAALERFKPDALAIELPGDSEPLVKALLQTPHKAPVAFLYYEEKHAEQAIYLPLAEFSPEYQALLYAANTGIPVHCIDLPSSISLCPENFRGDPSRSLNNEQRRMIADPIGYLAKRAGFRDSERWWENYFEQWTDHEQLFHVIQELMGNLRTMSEGLDDLETLLRERYMRQELKKIYRKKYSRLAVVCGAWHGPVLDLPIVVAHREEQLVFKREIQTRSCIIPWTYKHLRSSPSYTAGVPAPLWHECLFSDSRHAASSFLSRAAQTLRQEGWDVATSSVIDASVLSEQLAVLRELPTPGVDELMESMQVSFEKIPGVGLDDFEEKLLCGDVTGSIEVSSQSLPFIVEFHGRLKQLRLNRFWKEGHNEQVHLDLRKPNQLENSKFLHFTRLIELPWAHEETSELKSLGNFHEYWGFQWHPDLEISLVRIAMFGTTLQLAAVQYVRNLLQKVHALERLSKILENGLKSGIPDVWNPIGERIEELILEDQDLVQLCAMISPLVNSIDYGSLHKIDVRSIQSILDRLIPRVVLSFVARCKQVRDEQGKALMGAVIEVQNYFARRDREMHFGLWKDQVHVLASDPFVHPIIRGKAWSILMEEKWVTAENFLDAIGREFSLDRDIPQAAYWFEGFLQKPSLVIFLEEQILYCLDQWLLHQEEDHFQKHLPLLRRAFANVPASERQRIFMRMKGDSKNMGRPYQVLDPKRKAWLDELIPSGNTF